MRKEYYKWLCQMILDKEHTTQYGKLLDYLFSKVFRWVIANDDNRAKDGTSLRDRFAYEHGYSYQYAESQLQGPCSVLEMMVALSVRCEEDIMYDPDLGSRKNVWFWGMIKNLGLEEMNNINFDISYVDGVTERFLNREYASNGKGGLFSLVGNSVDLRKVEIWYQMCWYLDEIINF